MAIKAKAFENRFTDRMKGCMSNNLQWEQISICKFSLQIVSQLRTDCQPFRNYHFIIVIIPNSLLYSRTTIEHLEIENITCRKWRICLSTVCKPYPHNWSISRI